MALQGCPDASNDQAFIPLPGWMICTQAAPRGAGGLRLPAGSTYSSQTMSP